MDRLSWGLAGQRVGLGDYLEARAAEHGAASGMLHEIRLVEGLLA